MQEVSYFLVGIYRRRGRNIRTSRKKLFFLIIGFAFGLRPGAVTLGRGAEEAFLGRHFIGGKILSFFHWTVGTGQKSVRCADFDRNKPFRYGKVLGILIADQGI